MVRNRKEGDMKRIANFTLHDQTPFLEAWRKAGYEVDPTPRAPLVDLDRDPPLTEEEILEDVIDRVFRIREEGFDGILIGGLSNVMAYAWAAAWRFLLTVVMARTPRKRTEDGKFEFEFRGAFEVLPVLEVAIRCREKAKRLAEMEGRYEAI